MTERDLKFGTTLINKKTKKKYVLKTKEEVKSFMLYRLVPDTEEFDPTKIILKTKEEILDNFEPI